MSKDPAFLFYPNDYIGGTMGMTFEEKGAYMELLMMQFNRGHMTIHMIGQTVGQLWDKLQVKFIQDENGLWYNERLEEEQIKRQNFTQSRYNNMSGKNQYNKKVGHKKGHMTSHMENENENEVENRKGNCLLKNSDVTIQMVAAAFKETTDLINADPKYYFDTALDWSANGHMKKDWIATIRNFARRDIKDGKLKLSSHRQQVGINVSKDRLPDDYGTIRPGTMTLEEYKKLKKEKP